MDKTLSKLVDFTMNMPHLNASGRAAAQKVLFDSIGCIVLGTDSEPVEIAARLAKKTASHSDPSATVFCFGFKASPELAALANTMAVRYYDFNDSYPGHPSDMIPGVMAAGEVVHSSGIEVLDAINLTYEIAGAFGVGSPRRQPGMQRGSFDNTFVGVATALATSKMWGLTPDQMGHAASLALVSNLSIGAVRNGDNSVMVGCASAFGIRAGIFSTMLAMDGFTGPTEPFEGLRGLYEITGEYSLDLPVLKNGRSIMEQAVIKPMPSANTTIPILELMMRERSHAPLDQIESIEIQVGVQYDEHVASEHKYDPKDRKTADHSLPYMVVRALMDGHIDLDTAEDDKVLDPATRPIMRKVKVIGAQEMSDRARSRDPEEGQLLATRVKMRWADGHEIDELMSYHTGSPQANPGREFFDQKFDVVTRGIDPAKREELRKTWWNIENVSDIGEPIKTLAGIRQV